MADKDVGNGKKSFMTIIDVAHDAGVSAKTVSRVINKNGYISEKTRKRVQNAIDRLGYRPNRAARSLASNRSMVIGMAIPDVRNPYFAEVVSGVEHVVQSHGYNVLLLNTQSNLERQRYAFQILEEHRADGIILNTPTMPIAELKTLLTRQKAVVVIGHDPITDLAGFVNIDIRTAMMQAVDRMIGAGRWNLAYIPYSKNPDDAGFPHRERYEGYAAALQQHQITLNPEYVVASDDDLRSSYETTYDLLSAHPEINGIICYNDMMAFGAMDACDALGLAIPDQIAVIGFDGLPFSQLSRISLTTFSIPRFEVGIQAAQMLFDRISGHNEPKEIIIKTEFIHRASTPAVSGD